MRIRRIRLKCIWLECFRAATAGVEMCIRDRFCLMGADSFFGLSGWHRAAEIPFVASLIVASRPGQRPEEWITGLRAALPAGLNLEATASEPGGNDAELHTYTLENPAGDSAALYVLPGLEVEISASAVREMCIRDRR